MFRAGESRIELLEPTDEESPIARFIEKRGEGLHHIAYGTDDIAAVLQRLKEHNLELIDKEPRPGAHETLIAFIHPRSSGKVLTEICQQKK
jgi:methylmalonyl-CoA/ethylmalonyl-CoA epimerase